MRNFLIDGHYDPIEAVARQVGILIASKTLGTFPRDFFFERSDYVHWHLRDVSTFNGAIGVPLARNQKRLFFE